MVLLVPRDMKLKCLVPIGSTEVAMLLRFREGEDAEAKVPIVSPSFSHPQIIGIKTQINKNLSILMYLGTWADLVNSLH